MCSMLSHTSYVEHITLYDPPDMWHIEGVGRNPAVTRTLDKYINARSLKEGPASLQILQSNVTR